MKALLSTIVVLAGVTLTATHGFAADAAIPGDFAPVEFQRGFAPNRLDIYDLRRELAREAEHDRIRTRLGDPVRWCRPGGVPGYPGLPIVCR